VLISRDLDYLSSLRAGRVLYNDILVYYSGRLMEDLSPMTPARSQSLLSVIQWHC
jgi:hypothetical protein